MTRVYSICNLSDAGETDPITAHCLERALVNEMCGTSAIARRDLLNSAEGGYWVSDLDQDYLADDLNDDYLSTLKT